MWDKAALDIDVSRETQGKLEHYHALLVKWQRAINLVSGSTISQAWLRHFADSAQLVNLLPDSSFTLSDLGCGGGFPGLVLAMMRPDITVHLVESDERKCQFMKTVSRETALDNVTVHTARIEQKLMELSPDIITARALADLTLLLDFAWPVAQKNAALQMIFLKGEKWREEIENARKAYHFEISDYASCSDDRARILVITGLEKI